MSSNKSIRWFATEKLYCPGARVASTTNGGSGSSLAGSLLIGELGFAEGGWPATGGTYFLRGLRISSEWGSSLCTMEARRVDVLATTWERRMFCARLMLTRCSHCFTSTLSSRSFSLLCSMPSSYCPARVACGQCAPSTSCSKSLRRRSHSFNLLSTSLCRSLQRFLLLWLRKWSSRMRAMSVLIFPRRPSTVCNSSRSSPGK
mmetsp:Transcript_60928/g.107048  ORF Transcript_60928/g.107048 Transcript_60928/m.107048 type:complete len:203 (+) Transcript_60928:196-804(+)